MKPNARSLATLLALGLLPPAQADDPHERAKELDALIVTASPLRPSSEQVIKPITVLAGAELDQRKGATLGETVARETGVQSSFFGAGVGRPIIRGQDGARVQVLQGGVASLDASTVSVDHAVTIEPFLADQIEILRGPATLLYGPGAVGGAINVEDGRIAESLPERALSGRAELRAGNVDDGHTGLFRLDAATRSGLVFHVDGFRREAEDYRIPEEFEAAFHEDEIAEEQEGPLDRLENSAQETLGGALGLSWVGERGFLGAALSTYRSDYGIPGHAHGGHAEDEGDEHDDHHEDEEEHGEESVRIDLRQDRFDLRGALLSPMAWAERVNLRLSHSDYGHTELEGDEIGTRFDNQGLEGRIEVVQPLPAGWRSAWGSQFSTRDFEAIGDEAFVPPSRTRDLGLFWLAERDSESWKWELGARADRTRVDAVGGGERTFNGISASLGAQWRLSETLHLSLGFDRAQRAPSAEELFSDGPHLATQGYEVGDSGLGRETANQLELGLHLHVGPLEAKAAVFHNRFDAFIYLAETGLEEDGLPLRQWSQADARFNGFEAEARLRLADSEGGGWDIRVFGDSVRAQLTDGGNLPRIAPDRFGSELLWRFEGWRASVGAVRYASQGRVAEFETPTEGHTLVDAHLSYHFDVGDVGWELFLDGRNLGDRVAQVHTSYLKDRAPLPGRSLAMGVRVLF